MITSIINEFERAAGFAGLRKPYRLLLRPGQHFTGLFQRYILNNFAGIISERSCWLFTGDKVRVPLPAGLDIYLTGIKTHDSEIRLTRFLLMRNPETTRGEIAIDCGAHLGYYTLVLSHRFKKVICFEPSPRIGTLLLLNTKHKFNVTVVNAMLGDVEGEMPFFVHPVRYSEFNTGESSAVEEGFEKKVRTVTVAATTIDCYCATNGLIPSLIKIDVEGGELKLLNGAKKTIREHCPVIVIELRQEKYSTLYHPVVEVLTELGYLPYRITNDGSPESIQNVRHWVKGLNEESDNLVFSMSIGQVTSKD